MATGLFSKITGTLDGAIHNVAGELMFAQSVGTPPTTAGVFGVGCLVIDVTNSLLYINDGTVAVPTWNSLGAIAASEITLADGDYLVGNGSGLAQARTMSGDITQTNAGVTAIGALKVLTAMLAANAVTNAKIAVPKIGVIQQVIGVGDMTDNADATGEIDLTDLVPAGAVVLQTMISALTGFAGDTTAVATIGDGTDVDRYNTGTPDVFTTANHISAGVPSGVAYNLTAVTLRLTITGAADFTSIVTDGNGQVTITVFYYEV